MKGKKWKRYVSLLLALFCFFSAPLSVGQFQVKAEHAAETVTETEQSAEKMTEEETEKQTEQADEQEETAKEDVKETEKEIETETETETGKAGTGETLKETQTNIVPKENSQEETEQFLQSKSAAAEARSAMTRAVTESIYLDARENAIRLNKSDNVIVGDVDTRIPAEYVGYIRPVDAPERSYLEETFVPEIGALAGSTYCYHLTDDDKGRFYAWYRKSVYYKETWVDLKITLMDFKLAKDTAYFRFSNNRPGIGTYQVEWAKVRMEFFRADNGAPIEVKGYLTFRDIDLFQGIVLRKGFGQVYVSQEALKNLRTSTVNDNNYYFDITGINQSAGDKGFMLSALFQGSVIAATYTFVRPENDVGASRTPSGGITAESYKIFSSEHPNIKKEVSDSDEVLKTENTLKDKEETFIYTLTTTVPMETKDTAYQDFRVYDTLDDFLEIKSVSVTDENGVDASGWWDMTATNQFEAKCKKITEEDFYGHTYRFVITVGIRKNADLRARWDGSLSSAVIRNQAYAQSDGKTVASGTVITKIPPMPSSVQAEKKDNRTEELLDGAEFSIYEWNGNSYKTEPLAVLKNGTKGIYESGNILRYTTANAGKFKIIETKAPQGYLLQNWEQEFTISGFSQDVISFKGDSACMNPPQWIRVRAQKKDAETGKEAAGAAFTVRQWSQAAGAYVDMQTVFYSGKDGEALSPILYYHPDNLGKFQVEETQAPEKYFGDYRDGKKENGLRQYEFQINSENTGQTLTLSNTEDKTDFVNIPQKTKILVRKRGEVLCKAESDENGTVFSYEKQPLAGAEYEILAAEDIYKADGVTLALKQGAVAEKIVTDEEGKAISSPLYPGKYNIVEIKAPQGYVLGKTTAEQTKTVTLSYQGQEVQVFMQEVGIWENARPKAEVKVQKRSKDTGNPLAGAEFGLYAGEHIRVDGNIIVAKDTLIEKAESGTDGWCHFTADIPCGYSYYVKELRAPENYYKQTEKESYAFEYEYFDDKTVTYSFPEKDQEETAVFYNQEVRADISLQKLDAESNLAVPQQEAVLAGAVYGLYAQEDILSPEDGKSVIYKKDAEAARASTDESGKLCFEKMPLGNYYIKEIRASKGYLADAESYTVSCTYEGQDTAVIKRSAVSMERVKKQKFRIYKLTGDNKETDLEWLAGAGFSVFSVTELEKYVGLKEGTYAELTDEQLIQKIIDNYRDKNTLDYSGMKGIPTATVYEKGTNGKPREFRVPEIFTGEDGVLETCKLPYGRYLFVETTVPTGKTAAAPKVLTVSSDGEDDRIDGDGQGIPAGDLAIWDQPVTSFLKITKRDAFTGENLVRAGAAYVIHDIDGAYFEWYMKDKTSEEKIDYINRYGNLVAAYTNGEMAGTYENPYRTERRVNADGQYAGTYVATTEMLPEGLYILEEVKAPEGYVKQGFEGEYRRKNGSTFFEISSCQLPSWQAVHSLKVSKEDVGKWEFSEKASKSQRVQVHIGGDSANITYDRLAGAFVTEAYQENEPAVGKLSIYTEGEAVCGWSEQDGFVYEYRPTAGNTFLIRAAENIFSGEGTEKETLLFAKGSVVTELVTDEEGKAWTAEIEAAGYIWKGLPLGVYTVEQTGTADGYVLTEESQRPRAFEIVYAGEEVPIVYQDMLYENERQKISIWTEKRDKETKETVSGAVFGLYAGQDIRDAKTGQVLVKKDTLLQKVKTPAGLEGAEAAVFDLDLPLAFYYIREEEAPVGYYSTGVVCEIDARYQRGEENLVFDTVFENQQTLLLVNIMDYDTEQELDGVEFSVLDENGETVCTRVTVHNGNAVIRGLETGKRYTIRETKAREGYQWNLLEKESYQSVYETDGYSIQGVLYEGKKLLPKELEQNEAVICLPDSVGVQVVSLFNCHVTGQLNVKKEGEVPKTKIQKETLAELSYEVKGLPGAEYDIIAAENILHPDGYSEEIYQAGEVIGHLVTDDNGTASISGLYAGKYQVKETKAPKGYVRSMESEGKAAELCWGGSDASDMETSVVFQNLRQRPDMGTDPEGDLEDGKILNDKWKGKTGILKTGVDGEQGHALAGAEFTLYAKEDIVDVFGNIIIPKGTVIESAVSDAYGRAAFLTDLPMGTYCARETKPADGYYTTDTEILFDFEPYKEQDDVQIVRQQYSVKNVITQVKIFLKDDLTGNELAGAVFEITDEQGNLHSVFTTENTHGQGHIVKGLIPGKVYTIREKQSRSGYRKELLISEEMKTFLSKTDKTAATFSVLEAATDEELKNLLEIPVLELQNAFLTGDVQISKTGKILNEAERKVSTAENIFQKIKTWFVYIVGGVEKAEFSVFAAEDIYHPDGVTGLLYKKGELTEQQVRFEEKRSEAKTVTDQSGSAWLYGLYPGQYVLEETNIPEGYQKNTEKTEFTLADTGEETETLLPEEGILSVYNQRQQVEIRVTKRDKEHPEKALAGAVFGLYAAEDIKTRSGNILLEKDTLLETGQTASDGMVQFDGELPNAKYYIAELQAPAGYCSNPEVIEVDAGWKEEGAAVQAFQYDYYDEGTKVMVKKKASDTGEMLSGARLAVYKGSNCVESWITDGTGHCVEGLIVGETYILRELVPASGYASAEDVVFTVKDSQDGVYEIQELEMTDEPTEVHISVYEQDGDRKVSLGKVTAHLETADGNPVILDSSSHGGSGSWESVENNAEIWKKLPVGQYKIVVDSVPEGYILPGNSLITVQDTAQVQQFEILVQPICIRITAYAMPSKASPNQQEKTMTKGVWSYISGMYGEISKELPVIYDHVPAGNYSIFTEKVPDGYILPEKTEIQVKKDTEQIQDFEVQIYPTAIKLVAVDKKTQNVLDKVRVTVKNEKGKKIWKNILLPELKEKVIPANYTIKVEKVPEGYKKPEEKEITVKAVKKIQRFKIELEKENADEKDTKVSSGGTVGTFDGKGTDLKTGSGQKNTAAKTGDHSQLFVWLLLCLGALAVIVYSFSHLNFWKKRG